MTKWEPIKKQGNKMLNLNKHLEFFNPSKYEVPIHVIGVGAIGSFIAFQLTKIGVKELHIWDFDIVEEHNIPNQIYDQTDLDLTKVDALEKHLKAINNEINIIKHERYTTQEPQGIVFMAVDSIDIRKEFIKNNTLNPALILVIDVRMNLSSGQIFTTDWSKEDKIKTYFDMSNFEKKEVQSIVSACGTTLSVIPTVTLAASYAISQFMLFLKNEPYKDMINYDVFAALTK